MKRFVVDKNMRFLFALLNLNEIAVLQAAKLPIDLLNSQPVSLTTNEYFSLWTAIVDADQDDKPIPLKLVDIPMFAALSVPVIAALHSANFASFITRIKTYKPLIGPLALDICQDEVSLTITISHIDGETDLHPLIVAAELVFFVKLIREATDSHIVPLSIQCSSLLEHPGYEEYFGISVETGARNQICFRLEDTHQPFKLANAAVWENYEPELKRRLHELSGKDSFVDKVHAIIFELLPMGNCSLESVASKLCVSVRTAQRKLSQEGTNYQQALTLCREALAKKYLSSSQISITEISFLLGFEEPSSFSRAFVNWTGSTPELFRSHSLQ